MVGAVIVHVVEHEKGLLVLAAASTSASVGGYSLSSQDTVALYSRGVPPLSVGLPVGPGLLGVGRVADSFLSAATSLATGLVSGLAAVRLFVELGERLNSATRSAFLHETMLLICGAWSHVNAEALTVGNVTHIPIV